jgi:PAS domain S-box-containing protein
MHTEGNRVPPRVRWTIAAASGLLMVHGLILTMAPRGHLLVLGSNLTQLAASALASGIAIWVALRGGREARHFWLLMATSSMLWTLGQVLWTWEEYSLGPEQLGPAPTDVLFYFCFTPMLMALLLREERDRPEIDWVRVLDALQVTLLMVAAYVFLFYLPERRETGQAFYGQLLRIIFNSRNIFIAAAFAGRWMLTRNQNTRSLFLRGTIFLTVYAVSTGITNHFRLSAGNLTGNLTDLGWSLPFLVSAVITVGWESKPGPPPFQETYEGIRGLASVYLLPTLVPFGVVAMAAGITRENPILAYAAIFLSFFLYSVRLASTQYQLTHVAQAMEAAESRFDMMFARNPLPVWVFDMGTLRFLEVNDAAVQRYGYSREEFLRMKITEMRPPEDVPSLMKHLMEDHPISFHRSRHIKKDGKVLEVEVFAQDLEFGDRPAQIVIVQDHSEKMALEGQLRQSQKMEAVGTLAGGVAHDFNNLLTVISGYTRLLLDRFGEDEQAGHQLQQVAKASDRAAALTAQLLAFSRRQVLQPKQIDLNEIIVGMERMLHRVIGEDIEIETALDPRICLVKADPSQIEQVIMNLTANARDAMPNGGHLTFRTSNTRMEENEALQSGVPAGEFARLSVADTGNGMDAETQAHIFEPFFSTKKEKGTGLGLSTVYGIVKQSGGAIHVESAPGQGTRFDIFLPRIAATVKTAEEVAVPSKARGGSETILLVEDDGELRELARRVLAMNGYHVLTASKGSDALAASRTHAGDVHLLVTDVIMPGMSGKELAATMLGDRPKLKVLFVSGYAHDVINERGVLDPGTAFLQKPFSPSTLNQKVREMLDGSGSPVVMTR